MLKFPEPMSPNGKMSTQKPKTPLYSNGQRVRTATISSEKHFILKGLLEKRCLGKHDLKTLGKKADIAEKLTTYVARHSYATIMKKSGISNTVISEAMGHDSEKTTKIYLDSFENNILDEASKSIL